MKLSQPRTEEFTHDWTSVYSFSSLMLSTFYWLISSFSLTRAVSYTLEINYNQHKNKKCNFTYIPCSLLFIVKLKYKYAKVKYSVFVDYFDAVTVKLRLNSKVRCTSNKKNYMLEQNIYDKCCWYWLLDKHWQNTRAFS